MIDKSLIAKIRHLQLWAKNIANDALTGEYTSVFKGIGMEFDEFRKYMPGDDVKHIDWKVTARTREPYVKLYQEERDLTIMLMVDVSASQSFGLKKSREKVSAATELAALFAILATKKKDRVGLIIFTDEIEHYVPPSSGRAHVFNLIREVMTHKRRSKGTSIGQAIDYVGKAMKKKGLIILISDFQDDSYEKRLSILASKHDVVCAKVYDEAELRPGKTSCGGFVDPETGQYLSASYGLETQGTESMEHWQTTMRRLGVSPFVLKAHEDVAVPLSKFLKAREARLKR